jgi:hypothetical protein
LPVAHSSAHSASCDDTTARSCTTTAALSGGGAPPGAAMQPIATYPTGGTGRHTLTPGVSQTRT